jgi:ureidoglycolate lyase
MKLARFTVEERLHLGLINGHGVTSLSTHIPGLGEDMNGLIRRYGELKPTLRSLEQLPADYLISDVHLHAPVARPGKVMGLGFNYADHVREGNIEIPEHQTWFTKAVTAVNGPYDPIQRPAVSTMLDYEGELVVIIGKGGRHIGTDEAVDHIFGYCVGNDVSVRDWQRRSGQYSIGKSFDTHAPFGPYIVTADEIDPQSLPIRTLVNGELRQNSNTRHQIFTCAMQIEHLSQPMTLEPGDVIFTGTPSGVGAAMKPPRWLVPGDQVRVEIDGIGFIQNTVADE